MHISKHSGMDHTVLPADTPCLPFLHKHSPDGASPNWGKSYTSNCSLLLIYRPRKDERMSWPGWLTYSGRFTHKWSPVSYRSSAGQGKFASQRPTFCHCATQPTRRDNNIVGLLTLYRWATNYHTDGSHGVSQKLLQLGSPNWTQKCSTMSPGNSFILGSTQKVKGQGHKTQKTVPAWVFALLWVLASSSSKCNQFFTVVKRSTSNSSLKHLSRCLLSCI